MKEVTFLERLAENLLEGGFARALKPKLQPVQIAKALAREMERSQVVGAEGPLAANQYLAYLHPEDMAAVSEFKAGLEREFAGYLRGYAARHGLRTLSAPSVKLVLADPAQPRGRVTVKGSLVDADPVEPSAKVEAAPVLEGTVVMPVAQPEAPKVTEQPAVSPSEQPSAFLLDEAGHRFPLVEADTSIGRAVDNDIVLDASGVSRHHGRILWELGSERYVLLDLDSTNGSFVSGRRVTRCSLSEGEQLSFGGAIFTFHRSDTASDTSDAEEE